MITLEKLLTELKAESLNEIVASGGCGCKSTKHSMSHKTKTTKHKTKKSKHSGHCW